MSANFYSSEVCPSCKYEYTSGFNDKNYNRCPSCKIKYPNPTHRHVEGMNNIYHSDGCPALMSDGRFLTNYLSTRRLTDDIARLNGVSGTNNIKDFYNTRGTDIIDAERKHLLNNYLCRPKKSCSDGWKNFVANYMKIDNSETPKAYNDD